MAYLNITKISSNYTNGISVVVIVNEYSVPYLDDMLSAFFRMTDRLLYELFIADETTGSITRKITQNYAAKTFIRHMLDFKISSVAPLSSDWQFKITDVKAIDKRLLEKIRYSKIALVFTLEDVHKLVDGKLPLIDVSPTDLDSPAFPEQPFGSNGFRLTPAALSDQQISASTFGRKLEMLKSSIFPDKLATAIQKSEQIVKKTVARLQNQVLPLVTVIMPTYNRAAVIADSISTVIEQVYPRWELWICDDASNDNTESIVYSFKDARIRYLKLSKRGAAAARNAGLDRAEGDVIAYLDSDNYWHPAFLAVMVATLLEQPGRSSAYADFIDFHVDDHADIQIRSFQRPLFNHENLLQKSFIDLNSFVHTRELYDLFGGFNDHLSRRQDYDLMLKYTWLRDPLHLPCLLTLYHRNECLDQITQTQKHDNSCVSIINRSLEDYFHHGLPLQNKPAVKTVTILSWDMCRNHFSKPFALAEALCGEYDVQLVSFRFFDDEVFPPLKGVVPNFETIYLPGAMFPDFFKSMTEALNAIRGDILYVVKPRLPSLGLGLLANMYRSIPVILEINDLETVIESPQIEDKHEEITLANVNPGDKNLLNPYSNLWSQIMWHFAQNMPVVTTHNQNIDNHLGMRCLYMRNIKDEQIYDSGLYDRDRIREELGFVKDDRIILFGGMLRKHKGIYELVELLKHLHDSRYKLLFVGSRSSPDQEKLVEEHGQFITVLPPQDRRSMARINLAADLVILWLNPLVSASHYQMPYKLTDALAMETPIIANDISDIGELGRQGYLHLVPFGDYAAMTRSIQELFDNPESVNRMCQAGRRLYLRQFSYAAARANMSLAINRVLKTKPRIFSPAKNFTAFYDKFAKTAGIAKISDFWRV